MKTSRTNWNAIVWSLILIIGGIVLLLFNVGILKPYQAEVSLAVAALIAAAGLYFLGRFIIKVKTWWPTIPGFTLLSMAAIVYLAGHQPVNGILLASLLFVGLGLAFLVIFIIDRKQNWWAWITSGTLFTMIGTLYISSRAAAPTTIGAEIFGGIAIVFALLYLVVPLRQRLWWTLVQAGTMALAAIIVFLFGQDQNNLLVQLWPVLLVVIGVFIIGRQLSRPAEKEITPVPPTPSIPQPVLPEEPKPVEPVPGAGGALPSAEEIPSSAPHPLEETPTATDKTVAPPIEEGKEPAKLPTEGESQ